MQLVAHLVIQICKTRGGFGWLHCNGISDHQQATPFPVRHRVPSTLVQTSHRWAHTFMDIPNIPPHWINLLLSRCTSSSTRKALAVWPPESPGAVLSTAVAPGYPPASVSASNASSIKWLASVRALQSVNTKELRGN